MPTRRRSPGAPVGLGVGGHGSPLRATHSVVGRACLKSPRRAPVSGDRLRSAGAIDVGATGRGDASAGRAAQEGTRGATMVHVPWATHTNLPSFMTSMRTTAIRFDIEMISAVAEHVPPFTGLR